MKTSSLCRGAVLAIALALTNSCAADNSVVYRRGPILLGQTSPVELDMNQDGVADFRFTAGILAGLPTPGIPSTSTPYLEVFSFNRNDYLMDSQDRIALKTTGYNFEPKTKNGESWSHRASEGQLISSASGNAWSGFNENPSEAFLGVRFQSNGAAHYGWIRFVVPQTNPPAVFPVIADRAYEYRPNTAIRAGEGPRRP